MEDKFGSKVTLMLGSNMFSAGGSVHNNSRPSGTPSHGMNASILS